MKRWAAVVLVIVLLWLAGCTAIFGEPAATSQPQPSAKSLASMNRLATNMRITLFFPLADFSRMVAEQIAPNTTEEDLYSAALTAWLAGPRGEGLIPGVPNDVKLLGYRISESIAFIDLSEQFLRLSPVRRMIARACLTQTMTSFPEIDYVHILVNGQVWTNGGLPVSPATRGDGDLRTLAMQIKETPDMSDAPTHTNEPDAQPPEDAEWSHTVVCYFQDEQSSYLIPEIRRIQVESDLAESLIAELAKGPQDLSKGNTLSPRLKLASPSRYNAAAHTLTVDLSSEIAQLLQRESKRERLALGSIVMTLVQSIPDVKYIQFLMQGMPLPGYEAQNFVQNDIFDPIRDHGPERWALLSSRDFDDLLGRRVQLLFPNAAEGKLTPVYRAVAGERRDELRILAEETLAGPTEAEVIKYKLANGRDDSEYLLNVNGADAMVTVTLSADFLSKAQDMEERELRLWAYSLVNGLGQMSGVRWTVIDVEGEGQTMLNGVIGLDTPLLPDPGLEVGR